MPLAAKHFDPIVGIDIHTVLLPPGGAPVPLPVPYVGIVFDPSDYVWPDAATVFINGLPRAHAGTGGLALLPHPPPGGPFAPPAPNLESEIFMGSASVAVEGEPQSYMAMPVLSCQSIGVPPPKRPQRRSRIRSSRGISLVLPTCKVLALPMGRRVMVGGPPTISLASLEKRALSGLIQGPGLRAFRKLALSRGRLGRALRPLIRRARRAANKLEDRLYLGASLRNRVPRERCTVTGHPVDVATGKVFTDKVDLELPGPIPLRWERVWYSTSRYRGPLGDGWHGSYDAGLYLADDVVLYRTPDGRLVAFPPLERNAQHFDRAEGLTLIRDAGGYAIRDRARLLFRFRDVGRANGERVLASIRDEAGHAIELHHDPRGRLARLVDSAGRQLTFEHDSEGRIAALHGPDPERVGSRITLVQYAYDRGNLVRVLDALGIAERYRYRGALLVQETDRNGLSFGFEYDGTDEHARCVRTFGDGGIYDHKLSYDDVHGATTVVNSLGHATRCEHRDGLVVRRVDALGAVTSVDHDEYGSKLTETDAIGRVTRFRYDERGNPIEVVGPDGSAMLFEYDVCDRRTGACDAVGGRWRFRHDEQGALIERVDPLGQATRFEHANGEIVAIHDPGGGVTAFERDAQHNVACMRAPDGTARRFSHDALGRLTSVMDENENVQARSYDRNGRLTRVDEPDGNTRRFTYDGEGNVVRYADDHRDIELRYCGLGRIAARIEAGAAVRFEYDLEEQLTAVIDALGCAYRFERGPTGEVDAEQGFDGSRRSYARDGAGQVVEVVRPGGGVTRCRYDRAGRLTKVVHADGARQDYGYRADGALMRAHNATTAVTFERDLLGRVTRERQGQHWVASAYDARSARVGMQSSLGADQRIERDSAGRVAGVRHVAKDADSVFEARFRRDLFGYELERSLPGGVRSRWRRDRFGRPIEHALDAGMSTLSSRAYEWGKDDRLLSIDDAQHGAVRYGHDARGHLAWARHADGGAELRMPDAVGNLFRREDRSDCRYGAGGRLLESIDDGSRTTVFEHDAEGNVIEKRRSDGERWRYRWAADGTLREVERPDGSLVEFGYDALGRRVHKRCLGRTTRFVWDGDVPLHEWVEAAELAPPEQGRAGAPITWLFEPDSFRPMAKLVAGKKRAIIADAVGAPAAMLGDDGELGRIELGIRGEVRRSEGESHACPFRWPGQYEDAETGLYYNRFRYYDPDTGRYASPDPISLEGGTALYAYVHDPLTWIDPLGLSGCKGDRTIVFRGGARNASNLTPRPGKDMVGDKRGLSTFDTLEKATRPGGKAQEIDTAKLKRLVVHRSPDGHVSIRPETQAELEAWAATKGSGAVHEYTKEVMEALGNPVRRPR